jgi:hypothetical protein
MPPAIALSQKPQSTLWIHAGISGSRRALERQFMVIRDDDVDARLQQLRDTSLIARTAVRRYQHCRLVLEHARGQRLSDAIALRQSMTNIAA